MRLLHVVSSHADGSQCDQRCQGAAINLGATGQLSEIGEQAILDALESRPDADAVYGDIKIAGNTKRRSAWSPTRLASEPGCCLPLAVRCTTLAELGCRITDPDLPFRLVRSESLVLHVPAVVSCHSRAPAGAPVTEINNHLVEVGIAGTAVAGSEAGTYRIVPDPSHRPPLSIIIPTAGQPLGEGSHQELAVERCLRSVAALERPNLEIILVVGDEYQGDPEAINDFGLPIRLERRPPREFSFADACNRGLLTARNELVLLLNDDTEMDPGALDALAVHFGDPTIGAAGAMLRYPDGTVQHAGMVIVMAHPLHPFVGWQPSESRTHGGTLARDVIAVTGACLMSRRSLLLSVGAMSEQFPFSFNDVDLCLKIRRAGYRTIVEPGAMLMHRESLSRTAHIFDREWQRWLDRWGEVTDPWYHPDYHQPNDPTSLNLNANHLEPPVRRNHFQARDTSLSPRVHHRRRAENLETPASAP